MNFKQYSIVIVDLNPTIGAEMRKVRLCVVLSPTDANKYLRTVIVAPITSTVHSFKFRVFFQTKEIDPGEIALDHIRSLDKSRIIKSISELNPDTILKVKNTLKEFLIE